MSIQLDATKKVKLGTAVKDSEGSALPVDQYTVTFTLKDATGTVGDFDADDPHVFNPGLAGATGTFVATVETVNGATLEGSLDFTLVPGAPASVEIDVVPV